jgi:hypothetical protein
VTSTAYRFRILDEFAPELIQLQHHQRDVHREYERVLERIAAFPNELEETRAAALADKLEEMGSRIEYLEAQLLPFHHDEI